MANISFPALVAGHWQSAMVLPGPWYGSLTEFSIRFSDGHEDIFSLPDEEEELPLFLKPGSLPYAEALRHDLPVLAVAEPGRFLHVMPELLDGLRTNVWLVERDPEAGEEECIAVYYGGHYRFECCRMGDLQWQIHSRNYHFESIHEPLADAIKAWLIQSQPAIDTVEQLLRRK
jgi:hypothetical protein